MYLKKLLVPNEIHNSWIDKRNCQNNDICICSPGYNLLQSLHVGRCDYQLLIGTELNVLLRLIRRSCPCVMQIFVPSIVGCCCTNSAKKWSNSVVFSSIRKKLAHYLGAYFFRKHGYEHIFGTFVSRSVLTCQANTDQRVCRPCC